VAERPDLPVGGPTPGRKEVDSGTAVRGGVAAPTGGGEDDDLLAQAIAQIQAALAHARAGEWEQAGVCDSHCRAVVESLIADPNHPDPAGLAEGLTHVRAQYRELLSLAEAERDRLADSMRQSVRAKAGALAYEENR